MLSTSTGVALQVSEDGFGYFAHLARLERCERFCDPRSTSFPWNQPGDAQSVSGRRATLARARMLHLAEMQYHAPEHVSEVSNLIPLVRWHSGAVLSAYGEQDDARMQ